MLVVVVATGPSLTRAQCDATRGQNVLAVSNAHRYLPHARWTYAADLAWWDAYHAEVGTPARYSGDPEACRKYGLEYVLHAKGRNSGSRAMLLAAQLGAKRLVLLGFDFQYTGGRRHCFGDHPAGMRNADNPGGWLAAMPIVVGMLRAQGVSVVNATAATAIPASVIPRVTLAEALECGNIPPSASRVSP